VAARTTKEIKNNQSVWLMIMGQRSMVFAQSTSQREAGVVRTNHTVPMGMQAAPRCRTSSCFTSELCSDFVGCAGLYFCCVAPSQLVPCLLHSRTVA
jgi:hypothetical protein